jgi:TonB family protein
MFQHLEPGRRHRRSAASPITVAVSGGLHLIAIAGAAYLTVPGSGSAPDPAALHAEEYTLLPLFPPEPTSPAEEGARTEDGTVSEESVQTASQAANAAPPAVPTEAPFEIPPVDARLALEALLPDRRGTGSGDPHSSGVSAPALVLDSVIVLALQSPFRFAYDGDHPVEPPRIRNKQTMAELLADMYPRRLRFAGIPGMVTLRVVVDERGRVDPISVKLLSADREEFAMVALRTINRFQFAPARYRGQPVAMVVDLPISWVPSGY